MKILSVSVVSFGKLKNLNINFESGLNVLQNRNGMGKTTLSNFIRAMLYGFVKSKSSDKVNDVARYAPWNSSELFGGSMIVEHNGEQYRIERFFGKTASKEKCSVINVKTAKAVDFGTPVGEYLLGLTAESYDRSAYYPQEAVEISANDNFDKKLANLVQNGAEDFNKIQQRLYDYKKKLRLNKGNGGKLFELESERSNLQRKLIQSQRDEARNKAIAERLVEIDAEQRKADKDLQALKSEKDKLQKQLAKNQPSAEQLAVRSRLAELNEKLARTPKEFLDDKARLDEIDRQISSVKDDVKPVVQPSRKKYIAIISALIAVTVIGVALYLLTIPSPTDIILSAALVAVCIVAVVLITVFFKRRSITTLPSGEKDALISEYFQIAERYVFVGNTSFDEVRQAVWQAYSTYQGDLRARDELQKAVADNFDCETADIEEQLAVLCDRENTVSNKRLSLSQEQGSLTEERKRLSFDSVEIQDKILQVENEYRQAARNYETASIVEKLLEEAKDNLSTSYLPKLQNRCSKLLSQVTGKECQVLVDRDFNVSLAENGQLKSVAEFSRGIREITFLCFRIALAELLYNGEIPFIIIDDAFVNYDEENFIRATQLLKDLSKKAQIIYFTCHERLGALQKKSNK